MQTDIWLTENITYSELCPLCNKPLKNGSTTCFSCGFSTKSPTGTSVWIDPAVYGFPQISSRRKPHQVSQEKKWQSAREINKARRHTNPKTSIPQRASAQPSNASLGSIVNPQRGQNNATFSVEKQRKAKYRDTSEIVSESSALQHVQKNSSVLEYKTSASQTSVSLPPHALLISEEPTRPELAAQANVTHRLLPIDEITTVPPEKKDPSISNSKSLIPVHAQNDMTSVHRRDQHSTQLDLSRDDALTSWTAGKSSRSSQARLISSRSRRKSPHIAVSLNPIDRLRWWLLRPGRIEFILWLGGTILLVAVTCVLLFVTAFSFEWITPGFVNPSSTTTFGTTTGSGQQSTTIATTKLVLTLINKGPILPGQSIGIHGQGFSPLGHIRFLFDGTQQLFDQNGQSALTMANAQGVFKTTLVLDNNLALLPGPHFINAQDLTTKRIAKLAIILSPAPIGKGTPNTPVPSYPPGVTPPSVIPPALTPVPVSPVGPTPVGQTPVPITPTPHPVTPTATPTSTNTPTPTSTSTITPTPTGTPILSSSGLGNALDNPGDTYLGKQLMHLNPWVWLMLGCYCLSMMLLGIAGVLYKRNQ